jgi:hypothetical protein
MAEHSGEFPPFLIEKKVIFFSISDPMPESELLAIGGFSNEPEVFYEGPLRIRAPDGSMLDIEHVKITRDYDGPSAGNIDLHESDQFSKVVLKGSIKP